MRCSILFQLVKRCEIKGIDINEFYSILCCKKENCSIVWLLEIGTIV